MVGRNVLLLMDNCPAHAAGSLDIDNVKVEFLPPGTTSKLQPLDGGIIRAFKAHYRRRQASWILDQLSKGLRLEKCKPDVLDAIEMLMVAWKVDITASTIANCWRHCQLTSPIAEQPTNEVSEAMTRLEDSLEKLGYNDAIPVQELVDYNGEREIYGMRTEEEFFTSLKPTSPTFEEEEGGDDTVERSTYTAKQVREALEVLQGFALQKGDGDGESRKAIDRYRRCFSAELMPTLRQISLPDLFSRQSSNAECKAAQ